MERIRFFIFFTFLMSFTMLAAQSVFAHSQTGTITGDRVNVREHASMSAAVLGKVHTGDRVEILSSKNGWTNITYQGGTAWVNEQYVQTDKNEYSSSSQFVRIQTEGTNLRSGPSTSSSVIVQGSAGERYPIVSREGDWIKIRLASGNEAYVAGWVVSSKKAETSSLQGKVIVLDPGHGGIDGGTSGPSGTSEKSVTLQTAQKLSEELTQSGATVILTRSGDQFVPLPSRTGNAQYYGADAFISLHYDGSPSKKAAGFTTYYYHSQHKQLANSVNHGLEGALSSYNRGTRVGDYFVLRENERPAVLLELGYLTNPTEESSIVSSAYQAQAAAGVRDGLHSYFSN
ncbi:N-acetylmuramoyl-L-alanine amidase [Domibacillus tundrae]|uniref:N-acetylmuramoyl-L-alanine amidase n=1 Tax=Domibacillus tundrae TaxID=1587527 RepID=UPI0033926953